MGPSPSLPTCRSRGRPVAEPAPPPRPPPRPPRSPVRPPRPQAPGRRSPVLPPLPGDRPPHRPAGAPARGRALLGERPRGAPWCPLPAPSGRGESSCRRADARAPRSAPQRRVLPPPRGAASGGGAGSRGPGGGSPAHPRRQVPGFPSSVPVGVPAAAEASGLQRGFPGRRERAHTACLARARARGVGSGARPAAGGEVQGPRPHSPPSWPWGFPLQSGSPRPPPEPVPGRHPHRAWGSPGERHQDCGGPGDPWTGCFSRCAARLRPRDVAPGPPLLCAHGGRVRRSCGKADLTRQVWCGPRSLHLTSSQGTRILLARGAGFEEPG